MKWINSISAAVLGTLLISPAFGGIDDNFGVILGSGNATKGYTLFAPFRGTGVYLIDNKGRLINKWDEPNGYSAGGGMYLTKRGTLVRPVLVGGELGAGGGASGLIREYDWDGNILWEFEYNDDKVLLHHDIEVLPNGNVLAIAYERVTRSECEDKFGNNNPNVSCMTGTSDWIQSEQVIEIEPIKKKKKYTGEAKVVWKWRLFDHMLPANLNEEGDLIDPQPDSQDYPGLWDPITTNHWGRFNSIDYHPELDQILISNATPNRSNEIFIIDHNVTEKEAAGPKGDMLYRWGNPANYGLGVPEDQALGFQHTVRWIKSKEFGFDLGNPRGNHRQRKNARRNNVGNILIYSNRHQETGRCPLDVSFCSAVIEIKPPLEKDGSYWLSVGEPYGPEEPSIELIQIHDKSVEPPERTFYSHFISSAQKLPRGRYLIDTNNEIRVPPPDPFPPTELLEVKKSGKVVWKYVPPVYSHNPGRSPASDWLDGRKCPDGFLHAGAPELPGDQGIDGFDRATVWPFRATRYSPKFKGFKGKDMRPGESLTQGLPQDLTQCEFLGSP